MTFVLRRRVLGTRSELTIDQQRFSDIRVARDALSALLGIEEKFDLVLACYRELEETLLSLSLRSMMHQASGWSDAVADIQLVNRRLIALLSTGRMYMEQAEHDIRGVYGRRGALTAAISARMREAEDNLSYRIVDALRNYVQHRSLPVHKLTWNASWEGGAAEATRRCVHTIDPQVDVARLRGDRRFEEGVLEQMSGGRSHVNLRPLLQGYVATIGRVQEAIREATDADVSRWEETILVAERDFEAAFREGTVGLAAVHKEEDGRHREYVYVYSEPFQRRAALRQRNHSVQHYARHIVTSASRAEV